MMAEAQQSPSPPVLNAAAAVATSSSCTDHEPETSSLVEGLLHWELLKDPEIIEKCRSDLARTGVMVIPNFATPSGLDSLLEEMQEAPYNESQQYYTAWQDQGDYDTYPSQSQSPSTTTHPRNYKFKSSAGFVSRKTLEQNTSEKLGISLYYHDNNLLLDFVSKVANVNKLWHSQDENGSVYGYRIHSYHNPPWHFDEAPYTAILYLQQPKQSEEGGSGGGGEFEFVPWCRPTTSKNDPKGHDIVQEVIIEGKRNKVQQIPAIPGSLLFFCGSRSLHRAAPLIHHGGSGGDNNHSDQNKPRIGLVFTFGDSKGFENSDNVRNANEWDPDE